MAQPEPVALNIVGMKLHTKGASVCASVCNIEIEAVPYFICYYSILGDDTYAKSALCIKRCYSGYIFVTDIPQFCNVFDRVL